MVNCKHDVFKAITVTSSILSRCRVRQYQTAALPLVQGTTVDTLLVKYRLFGAFCVMNLTN